MTPGTVWHIISVTRESNKYSNQMPVFLFTDIEGSTQLWEIHGRAMGDALSRHDAIMTRCVGKHGGRIVKHTGDGVFAAFEEGNPLECAVAILEAFHEADWELLGNLDIRMALHSGEAEIRSDDYFGSAVNHTARLLNAAWGGQILLSEAVVSAYPVPEGAALVDHGVHMLKDLGHPQRIFGLVPERVSERRFPPLRSLSTRAHNLPPQPTPFINRKVELTEIMERLEQPSCRLLTILGSGGIGKTRLSLQVAAEKIDSFAHGVYQVPLASLSKIGFIYAKIADAVGLPLTGPGQPQQKLFGYLRDKEILLILDNFEHLTARADIVADLLEAAPQAKVLVTSRERLNLHGEWVYELVGMEVPVRAGREGVEQYSAVQLFLQNAYRVHPSYELDEKEKAAVVEICELVEGIPLGIELASSWVRVLSGEEIVREIRKNRDFLMTSSADVPRRHQSLRAVFENSWQLLSPEERPVLRELSVFRGGFQREAALAVANARLPSLLSLSDKSLLRRVAGTRFEMLETLRQYAGEKLAALPQLQEATRGRHSMYYLKLLNRYEDDLRGGQQVEALAAIEAEIENIRQAWQYALSRANWNRIELGLKGLFLFYEIRGLLQEGRQAFQQAYDLLAHHPDTRQQEVVRGTILLRRGWFAYRLGDYEEAQADLEESLELFRRLEEADETAFALYNLGILSYQLGKYQKAEQVLEESLRLRREIGKKFDVARSLSILGVVARDQGQYGKAERLLTRSLIAHREVGDLRGTSRCLNLLALIRRDMGDNHMARKSLEESLEISREIGDQMGIGFALAILGAILCEIGDYIEARELVQESLEIRQKIGDRRGTAFSLNDLGNVALALDKTERARDYYLRALQTALDIKAVPLALYVLSGIARLQAAEGKQEEALRLATLVERHPASFEMAIEKARALHQEIVEEVTTEHRDRLDAEVGADDFEETVASLLAQKVPG